MSHFAGASARRLVASVQKLERTLATPACRAFVARLPVCWLCWHYCRMLDQKIARMRKIAGKFDSWGPTIRDLAGGAGKAGNAGPRPQHAHRH
jgi:hypothetical protein